MDKNIIGLIVTTVYIAFVILTSKLFEKKGEEISRKYMHIMLSNIWFMIIFLFDNYIIAAILPAFFVIVNALSHKFNLIKTMERKEGDTLGTVYYAIVLLIIVLWTVSKHNQIIGLPGVLIMGYGDGLAAVVGKKVKSKQFKIFGDTKSIAGSTTMFVVSLLISLITFNVIGMSYFVVKAIFTAAIATVLEAISAKGLDNITVPLIITIMVAFMV